MHQTYYYTNIIHDKYIHYTEDMYYPYECDILEIRRLYTPMNSNIIYNTYMFTHCMVKLNLVIEVDDYFSQRRSVLSYMVLPEYTIGVENRRYINLNPYQFTVLPFNLKSKKLEYKLKCQKNIFTQNQRITTPTVSLRISLLLSFFILCIVMMLLLILI